MLPDFLIIGAMKSGTTSLYADLKTHPSIFLPEDKEPSCLASDEVLTDAGQAPYGGVPGLCGDPFGSSLDNPPSNFKAMPCDIQETYQEGGIIQAQVILPQ